MHRFRYDGLEGEETGKTVELGRGESSHLFKTLRAAPGFEIELLDGAGRVAKAIVVENRAVEIVSIELREPPKRRLHLYIAPPRRQKMDQILRQCAELGVWAIKPAICARSVSEPDESSVSGRWEDVLMDACKQSGNPQTPKTSAPVRFAAAVEEATKTCVRRYFGAVDGAGERNPEDKAEGDVAWFIGPEGGFTEEEEGLLKAKGFAPLRIGRHILRVETAAVCGAAMLL